MFTKSARFYDAVYSFKDYAAESERIHALIEERSPGASTLLDVACGTGKHLELLRAWYEVSGLDLDPELVEIAKERLGDVELHEGDMTAFSLGRRFDVVTCLFSSIGYVGTVELLRRHPEVTAVFAANDTMALGARAALREVGREVPEDVALVGFDNSLLANSRFLDLTTVDNRGFDIGVAAGEALLRRLADADAVPEHIVIPSRLVVRSSSASAPH